MITLANNDITDVTVNGISLTDYREFYSNFGYTYYDLTNRSRLQEIVMIRSCIIKHLFNYRGMNYVKIGELFNKDRTTMMHLQKKSVKYDLSFKYYWNIFEKIMKLN